MDDDKDSFIVFIESESFDKTQKLKHDFYPESDKGYSFLELCCYHGAVDCFKLLRTKFNSEINPQCLQFSFLSGKPDILNECLKFQIPDQECMKYAIISFNVDFITFLNREYGLEIDLDTCRLWRNYQAFFIHLDVSNDIENCFPYTPCRVVRFPTIGVLEDLPGVIIVSLNQKFYFGVSFIDFSIKNICKTRK
ncbi:hypothetical protein TVAG_314480 [Trichomonas vaginalis G3]|uniref:DUF3447 domain-containing protein n=1 Tax=Trichomonas vaginalis (strain ATCC PRA-98 / G3) TaxID=412133 RepID=A2GPY5_TRIV3|nr:spectrin binding [Trichomonas vaginalis G3]EAX80782.1 hypothetical protein TVAG_314480 [Trichomonas vaginalis G3]KAI5543216.1 spectrin binding [Trichomonas vaginalis G3]|eukprot:XP_001293712.1 hypothetical protein [Trichomonas vaginalis G3]